MSENHKSLTELCLPSYEDKEDETAFIAERLQLSFLDERRGVCEHAVAHGKLVLGGLTTSKHKENSGNWWTWETKLDHEVESIASNADGSVVVVTTNAGTVSLLRGCDGRAIATRQVVSEADHSASVSWILGNDDNKNLDCLLLELQTSEKTSYMLVLNVDGKRLNQSHDPSQVATAARMIQLQALPLEQEVLGLSGYFSGEGIIRFLACNGEGSLVVMDYVLSTKSFTTVKESTAFEIEDTSDWTIRHDLGFARLHFDSQDSFFLFAVTSPQQQSAIVVYDPSHLQVSCTFRFSDARSSKEEVRSKVLSVTPLYTPDKNSIAFVAAEKTSTQDRKESSTNIVVVQVPIDETMGLFVLSSPHVLYRIPLDEASTLSMTLAPQSTKEPYSFFYKVWHSAHECSVASFCPDQSSSVMISSFRLSLQREDLEGARSQIGNGDTVKQMMEEPYAEFHPAEFALKRFQIWLRQGDMSTVKEASECIQELTSGASSANPKALWAMLEAIRSLVESASSSTRSLGELIFGLSTFSACLNDVEKSLPEDTAVAVSRKRTSLEKQLRAWQGLEQLGPCRPVLQTPLSTIRSPAHLFAVMMEEAKFEEAEMFVRSGGIFQMTSEEMVSPFCKLSPTVPPRHYLSLLKDLVMPRLFANDESLVGLRAWSCRTADSLDDEGRLEESILLLETIDGGTKAIRAKMHSSFSSFSPFVDSSKVPRMRTPRSSNTSQENSYLDVTEGARKTASDAFDVCSANHPIPTILELGALKKGASKIRSRMTGVFAEGEVAYEGIEDCVETKLMTAHCLLKCRRLGLSRDVVSVRTFQDKGGVQLVATELARLLSANAVDHSARENKFFTVLRPFCTEHVASYDDALLTCTKALCRSQTVTNESIVESASIARCCMSDVFKCHATLVILRSSLLSGCSPNDVAALSRDAFSWASCDSVLQSEVEEATRLLTIDRIVLRYCGKQAKEMFRVDNSRHAVRLMAFVARHVNSAEVLGDILALCNAFHQFSRAEAVSSVMHNCINRHPPQRSVVLLDELYQTDSLLAQATLMRSLVLVEDILGTSCPLEDDHGLVSLRKRQESASQHALALLDCALKYTDAFDGDCMFELVGFFEDNKVATIRRGFQRVVRLREDHGIYASLSKLSSASFVYSQTRRVVKDMIEKCCVDTNMLQTSLTTAKRACGLLCGQSQIEHSAIWSAVSGDVLASIFASQSCDTLTTYVADLLGSDTKEIPHITQARIAIAAAACGHSLTTVQSGASERMNCILLSSILLNHVAVRACPASMLGEVVRIGTTVSLFSDVLARADEGMGEHFESQSRMYRSRFSAALPCIATSSCQKPPRALRPPRLHLMWYVGDGLLLPPDQILSQGLVFLKWLLSCGGSDYAFNNFFDLVMGRGALFLSSRLLSTTSGTLISRGMRQNDRESAERLEALLEELDVALSERCLGGIGTGITNAVVDSQLSLSYLVSLPTKQAFATFRASIPTAVKTRDFSRLLSLASIGIAGTVSESESGIPLAFSTKWRGQKKFLDQCKQLFRRAQWSIILSKYRVSFDINRFDGVDGVEYVSDTIASSVIPGVAAVLNTADTITLTVSFARTFGVSKDVVVEKMIEYLLAPAPKAASATPRSPVEKESSIACAVQQLRNPLKRKVALMRSIVALEKETTCCVNYELHSIVLSHCRDSLAQILDDSSGTIMQGMDTLSYEHELEFIDRRRDALTVLMAFFQGERAKYRPSFPSFFQPMDQKQKRRCGVLGTSVDDEGFDPLSPIEAIFREFPDSATTSSLAPLCLPLGLPAGYVHARSLVVRFQQAHTSTGAFPSFHHDVVPTCDRLRFLDDKRRLAEWCAVTYTNRDEDKLRCLEYALDFALQCSAEVESKLEGSNKSERILNAHKEALEDIKRLTSAKQTLSDVIRVKAILRATGAHYSTSTRQAAEQLVCSLDHLPENATPERLALFLVEEGSRISASFCVGSTDTFSYKQLQQFCRLVHEASAAISEQYSHVHPYHIATRFAKKWLLYGDEDVENEHDVNDSAPIEETVDENGSDEDTMNFVMDLNNIESNGGWDPTSYERGGTESKKLTSEEEPSSIKQTSGREVSEMACTRASIRIAFALSFPRPLEDNTREKENSGNVRNRGRQLLLSKIDTKRDTQQEDRVLHLCRELSRIVFAGSNSSTASMSMLDSSFDSVVDSRHVGSKSQSKSITFAMRHRALRVLSLLCPQEAIEKILRNEKLTSRTQAVDIELKQCSFAAFVAKEIEEMRLPLPHADLIRLSSMHFLSFARTLWRDHWPSVGTQSKGRLLLLLVEMSLRSRQTDGSFVASLLQEAASLRLPRTLLLSLECLRDYAVRFGTDEILSDVQLRQSMDLVTTLLVQEVQSLDDLSEGDTIEDLKRTFDRLYQIVVGFSLVVNNTELRVAGLLVSCINQVSEYLSDHSCLLSSLEEKRSRLQTGRFWSKTMSRSSPST